MDNTVKLWRVPEHFTADITEAETTLYGHDKKVRFFLKKIQIG
jgi:hypothetical protein